MHGKWPTKKVWRSVRRVRIHAYRGALTGRYPGGTPPHEVAAAPADPHCWTHPAARRGRRGATGRGGGRIPFFAAEMPLHEIPPRANKGAAYRVGDRRALGRKEATLGRARPSACCFTVLPQGGKCYTAHLFTHAIMCGRLDLALRGREDGIMQGPAPGPFCRGGCHATRCRLLTRALAHARPPSSRTGCPRRPARVRQGPLPLAWERLAQAVDVGCAGSSFENEGKAPARGWCAAGAYGW